jgi:hypothetical protein
MLHELSAEGVKRGLDQERMDDLSIKMMNTWILRMRSPISSPQAACMVPVTASSIGFYAFMNFCALD